MSTVDVAALRETAERATPGPWHVERSEESEQLEVYSADGTHLCEVSEWSRWLGNATFIAAADPTTILALIERLEAAEGAVERVRALIDELQRLALPGMTPWDYAEDFRAALDGDQP